MDAVQLEQLLLEVVRESHRTHTTVVALIQMLIDQKVLKGDETTIMREIDDRAKDLGREDLDEAWVKERARTLREAWSMLPKQ